MTVTENGTQAGNITVTAVDISTQPGDPYAEAPQNGDYAVVHVSAQADNSFTQGFEVNPVDFYVLINGTHYSDLDGHGYEALSESESEMSVVTLGAGESAAGLIPFDISGAHGTVVYAPNSDGQPLAEWNF